MQDDDVMLSAQVVEPEVQLDIDMVDPRKVNWFKFLVDKHLSQQNSALNNNDAYANLL